jgi:hypothetical protein
MFLTFSRRFFLFRNNTQDTKRTNRHLRHGFCSYFVISILSLISKFTVMNRVFKITVFVSLCLWSLQSSSQSKKNEACSMIADRQLGIQYAGKPDTDAQFEGGKDSLKSFLKKHAALIKAENVNVCESSKASVEFIVKKDGSIAYISLVKPASCDALKRYIDEMFSRMPVWKPALCNGKAVNSKQSATISLLK